MSVAGYEENVNDALKLQNIDKLEGLKKKVSDIEQAIQNFTELKASEKK